jgi:DNA primase
MLIQQEKILGVLNRLLKQSPKMRKGTEFLYICPFCSKKNKRKLEISITGKYHCWICGFSGLSFHSLFHKLNAPAEAYSILGDIKKPNVSSNEFDNLFKDPIEIKEHCQLPKEYVSFLETDAGFVAKNALNYIKSRGITEVDIYRYGIGYCPDGEYKNRILIPSYDSCGNLNFYSCRDFYGKSNMRYLLSPYSKNMIGFENLINFDDAVTLVEGTFDAIAVRKNAIPLFGKSLSDKLKTKLLENKPPIVNVLLDLDAAKNAIKICEFLIRNNIPTKLVSLKEKDPSDIGFEKTWEYINSTKLLNFETMLMHKINL